MVASISELLGAFSIVLRTLQIQDTFHLPLHDCQHVETGRISPLVGTSRFGNHSGYIFLSHTDLRCINPPS